MLLTAQKLKALQPEVEVEAAVASDAAAQSTAMVDGSDDEEEPDPHYHKPIIYSMKNVPKLYAVTPEQLAYLFSLDHYCSALMDSNIIGQELEAKYGNILNSQDPESLKSLAFLLGPEIWKGMYSSGETVTLECRVPLAITAALRRVLDRLDAQLSWKDEAPAKTSKKKEEVDFNQVSFKKSQKRGTVALKKTLKKT